MSYTFNFNIFSVLHKMRFIYLYIYGKNRLHEEEVVKFRFFLHQYNLFLDLKNTLVNKYFESNLYFNYFDN